MDGEDLAVRVVRGNPDAHEIAALTALLAAVLRRTASAAPVVRPRAGWARGQATGDRRRPTWRAKT